MIFLSKKLKQRADQFTAGIHYGDAITLESMNIKNILKKQGFESEIYTNIDHTGDREKKIVRDFKTYKPASPDDIIIYHYSTHSPISDFLKNVKARKILRYHNITPYIYFSKINPQLCEELKRGRGEIIKLKEFFDQSLSDSDFNSEELRRIGFKNVHTLPIIINFSLYEIPPAKHILKLKSKTPGTILYVGRVVPNKKYEDVIRAFFYYKKYINKDARLFLVGSWGSSAMYYENLKSLVSQMKIKDVYFTGHISQEELVGYYWISDIFLSMSEHEGFGVPLVESMYFGLPIVAFKSSAVPETLGESGILLSEKNFQMIGELIDAILSDKALREKIIKKQKDRLEFFKIENQSKRLINFLTQL